MTHSTTWNLVKQQGLLHRWWPQKRNNSEPNNFVTWRGWGSSSVQNPIIMNLIFFHFGNDDDGGNVKMTFHSVPLKYSLAQFESIYCNKLSVCCCQIHFYHETIMMRMKVTIIMMWWWCWCWWWQGWCWWWQGWSWWWQRWWWWSSKSHPICLLLWQCAHCSKYSNVCQVTKT